MNDPPSSSLTCILILSLLLTLFTFVLSPIFPLPIPIPIPTTTTSTAKHTCNLFKGRWVPTQTTTTTLYTHKSCGTLPSSKNCLLHGRPDTGFLRWRWAPEGGCNVSVFNALGFLGLVEGKTMAFVGDSVARNQVDSLLCMLAVAETPLDVYKDTKDRSHTWYFPRHNFTLMVLWTRFLVKHKERGLNGSPTGTFDLHLDQLDENWATQFQPNRPPIHYTIFSDSQWFFRQNFLYKKGQLIGCTNCNDTSTKDLGPIFAIQMALRTSLGHITTSNSSKGGVTIVRTISPSHFEGGTWKTGGQCERKGPFESEGGEVKELIRKGSGGLEWEVRRAQVEEVERAKLEGKGLGLVFEALDITWAMLMRPDGHPGQYWRDKRKRGFNDCVHWCLPGPVDTWNELLWVLLR